MSVPQKDSSKVNGKPQSSSSSANIIAGKGEHLDSSVKARNLRSASPSPNKEVLRLKRYRVQLLLEGEREKERLEKAKSEREKKLQELRRGSPDVLTPKSEKKSDPAAKLLEIRHNWEKAQSELLMKTEANSREMEMHLKHFQDQRLSVLEARARSNRSRLAEVRECKSHLTQEEEQQMSVRLKETQRKMEKSRELHSALLQSRSQSAARKRGVAGSASPARNEEEMLLEYLRKVKSRSTKKMQARLEYLREKESLKKMKLERWGKVENNQKTQQQKILEWTKAIEQKHNVAMATIESRVSENLRSVAGRSEQQRERAGLCLLNRVKLQHDQTTRKADLLNKWAETGKRVEALKKQRVMSVERHRNQQHSTMLERERLNEVLEVVARSPQSRKAQKLLKCLGD